MWLGIWPVSAVLLSNLTDCCVHVDFAESSMEGSIETFALPVLDGVSSCKGQSRCSAKTSFLAWWRSALVPLVQRRSLALFHQCKGARQE